MIIINDTLGTYGGSITLLLRMFGWLSSNHIDSAMITDSMENSEAVEQLKGLGINIFQVDTRKPHEVIPIIRQYSGSLKIINFYWDKYLDIECVKRTGHISFDNVMYDIHPAAFDKGSTRGNSFLTDKVKDVYYSILCKMNANRSLVFVDPINVRHTEGYYEKKFEKKPIILRIPMEYRDEDLGMDEAKKRYDANIILTASRADFPFKGYLIGLIDTFVRFAKDNPCVQLEIIAGGRDADILEKKISEVTETIRNRIIYKKWMTYEELKNEIRKAKVFVGMGTSIIDAAKASIPSIPVLFDTYKCKSNGIFHEFSEFTSYEDCTTDIGIYLQELLSLSFDEYYNISRLTYDKMIEEYEINKIMQRFLDLHTINKSCLLNQQEYMLHKLNTMKNRILYNNKRYSYKNVK